MTVILDPTDESVPVQRSLAARTGSLSGSIALLDISKPRGNVLLDRIEEVLGQRFPGLTVNRYTKPAYTRPAPKDLRREIREKNRYVIEALAD